MRAIEAAPPLTPSAASPSFYELLGVEPSASTDQVRMAYLKLVCCHSPANRSSMELTGLLTQAKAWHPDRVAPGKRDEAKRRFQDLAEAYMALSDSELLRMQSRWNHADCRRSAEGRREEYDVALAWEVSSAFAPPPLHPLHTSLERTGPAPYTTLDYNEERLARPESPFPGHRVPPGGYPQARLVALSQAVAPSARPDLPDPVQLGASEDLASRIEAIFAGMHDLALGGDLHHLDRSRPRHRGHSPPDHRHSHGNRVYDHAGHGNQGWNGRWPHQGDACKTARKEWTEATTERNGDRVVSFTSMQRIVTRAYIEADHLLLQAKAGRHEVKYYEDGTTKWRSSSTTIISHAVSFIPSGFNVREVTHVAFPCLQQRHRAHSPCNLEHGIARPLLTYPTHRPPSPGLPLPSPHYRTHHQHHRHRSHSVPPLALGPAHSSPPHIATRSPGGYIPGPSRHYDAYSPRFIADGGHHAHGRYGHRPGPEYGHSSPLFGGKPEWRKRERELVL